jgi:hypothetical protein
LTIAVATILVQLSGLGNKRNIFIAEPARDRDVH